jgi:hypothetical protein
MSFQPVIQTLSKIFLAIVAFIPLLVNSLIILAIGYLVSKLVRWGVQFLLNRLGVQRLADRTGLGPTLHRWGLRTPLPQLIANIVYFFLLLSFATSALRVLDFSVVANFLDSVLLLIPRAISAALLVLIGSLLARILGNTITVIARNTNIVYGRVLGSIIEYGIVALVIIIAISILGLDTTVLTTSLMIILASVGVALALTFGLGARDAAKNVIAGYYIRQQFRPGQDLSLAGHRGKLRSVSGAYTVLEEADEAGQITTVVVPNTFLMQQVILGQQESTDL